MFLKHRIGMAWFLCILVGPAALLGSGCSSGINNEPVDAAVARDTLQKALESWKKGDKVDALQQASPPIYVIDMEWQGGATLKEYEIVGAGEAKDAHLLCKVKLTVRGPGGGKEVKKEQTYVISTAPNLTVSRMVF